MNGLEALEELRHVQDSTPVVMISGESTLSNVKKAKEFDACGFIVKPFNVVKLKIILSRLDLVK